MQYAVWIALAVVFIAIAPALFKSAKGKDTGKPNTGGDAGVGVHTDGSDGSDGSDGGDGGGGGGD